MKSPQSNPIAGDSPAPDSHSTEDGGGLRLAIVSRRFWPYAGSTELAAGDLAGALNRAGHSVDILTIRWEKTWPSYFNYQESPVRRINRPATGPWGSYRYLRNLNQAIDELNPDGIIVFGLGDEAWSIAKNYDGQIPFVIRIDNHFLGSKTVQAPLNNHQIASLTAAKKILCESEWTAERLRKNPAVNSPNILPKIVVAPEPIWIDENHRRTPARQGSSRIAVSDAHPVLMIEPTQPLVVTGAPMNGDNGMLDLVNAWPRVLKRYPKARLWIFGEGKKSQRIWDRVNDKHLVSSVIMPGSFDDLEDVFQAADLYIHPQRCEESCSFLARAMASGLCPIVTDTRATKSLIQHDTNGFVVNAGDTAALTQAMLTTLDNRDLRDRLGRAGARSAANNYDATKIFSDFIDVLKV